MKKWTPHNKVLTFDGITIYFVLNRDNTVNLRRRMLAKYQTPSGVNVIKILLPVAHRDKGYGLVKDQIDLIKQLER